MYKKINKLAFPICCLLLSFAMLPAAHAVPSYARQTGMSCSGCHTAFPQLNAVGRQFKMQGYTFTNQDLVKGDGLSINVGAPFSMMIQTTWSHIKSAPDAATDKSKLLLPAQLSVFYAGRISDNIGSFIQITAEQGGGFGIDNTDIRYAKSGKVGNNSVDYGLSLNNNPTVQDPWNSTPVWGFPWFEAGYGYEFPDNLITAVGGDVAGLTAYGFWNSHIYTEIGGYSAANTDAVKADKVIRGAAPYGRIAYTGDANKGNMNWEVGVLGMRGKLLTNENLTDVGIDGEIQLALDGDQSLTVDANYIHEGQSGSEHLNTMKVDVTWYTNQTYGVTVGYHGSKSSSNAISGTDDTNVGRWNSDAFQVQLDYNPWLNTRLALQYTGYTKLEDSSAGASDSNQWMLGGWFLF